MSWEIVLQSITAALGGFGIWCIYDLIREFKAFKSETKNDVFSLKQERNSFQNTVKSAELTINSKVNDMHKLHSTFALDVKESLFKINDEISKMSFAIKSSTKKTENFESFLQKCLLVTKTLNEKVKNQETEIKKINEVLIFKTKR